MRKYRLSTCALLFGVYVFFNLQCEKTYLPVDSSAKIDYLQGNTEARVIIKVFDNHSYAPLSGAMVTIVGVDSTESDMTGTAVFDSVKVGSYLIACRKDGFESAIDQFVLTVDSNSNTVPVVNQSTDIMSLARKGAAIRGSLYYRKDSNLYPADGAMVECRLTNPSIGFQNPLVTATTDNGVYSFTDLPEYSAYTITILPFSDGSFTYKQAGAANLAGRAAGDTLRAADVVLEKFTDGNFIVLSHNLETFTKTDSLVFEFSEAVDIDKLGPDSIYINLSPAGTRILTTRVWRNGNTKLYIIPFDGNWNILQEYTLVMRKFTSVSGKPFNNTEFLSYTFAPLTTGFVGNVQNLRVRVGTSDTTRVDYNTSSITLLWTKLTNATSYQIFQKSSSDSSWTYLTSAADTTAPITTSGKFNYGNQMKFIVLGRNSTTTSSFENAVILTVQDQKRPYISTSTTWTGFNHSASNYVDTIDIVVSSGYLPEPMDTTAKPSVTVKEASYLSGLTLYGDTLYAIDPNRCFWTWTSDRTGVMSVILDPLRNASYDSLKIDFTSVPDWAGNEPETAGGAGFLNIQTRP